MNIQYVITSSKSNQMLIEGAVKKFFLANEEANFRLILKSKETWLKVIADILSEKSLAMI